MKPQRKGFHRTLAIVGALVGGALLLQGCSSEQSDLVATNGIRADYLVSGKNSGPLQATAYLKLGGGLAPTYLILNQDDRLAAEAGGESIGMAQFVEVFGQVGYRATLPEAANVRIVFTRKGEAHAAEVAVPPDFRIVAPAASRRIDPDETLDIRWEPPRPGQSIQAEVSADCPSDTGEIQTLSGTRQFPDNGQASLSFAALLQGQVGRLDPSQCQAYALKLSRIDNGEPPAGLHPDSRIRARRQQILSFAN